MSFFILGEVNKGHGESRFVFPKYSISESRGKRQELLIFLLMMRKSLDNLHVGIFLPGSSPQIPNVLDCILNAYFKPNIARTEEKQLIVRNVTSLPSSVGHKSRDLLEKDGR